ncbi:MAG: universal stress protein [Parvibaculum sp.]|uniref:universal stress protein n=1 Tax=Parvibaculum sp. TaxID=2024848 RepID=UPI003C734DD0
MFKSILVPATGFSGGPIVLETALAVARTFGSHLDCVHVRPDPSQIFMQAAGYDIGMGTGTTFIIGDIAAVLQEEDRNRTARVKHVFETFCAQEKLEQISAPPCKRAPSSSWTEIMGREADVMMEQARVHDLTIMGHPTLSDSPMASLTGALLVGSGRPLLLAPKLVPAHIGETIAIAWKSTPEAARAVTAAMPFLSRARQVVLIAIAEHESVTVESADALAKTLRWHDISTEIRYLAHSAGSIHDTILMIAREAGADMLVMGGYSHTRLSELIFGGFTRHVLAGAQLPIFMAH